MWKYLFVFIFISLVNSQIIYAQSKCEYHFPVKVKDSILVLNDGTDRRFFLSGMVDNDASNGMQLSKHDKATMKQQIIDAKNMGANSIRWNAFLKGLDFKWDKDGKIIGICPDCHSNIKEGLDLAYENGILVQIVLSTAHFLKFGWGGPTNILNGISNEDRVTNNYNMLTTDQGIQDYIQNIITPMCDTIGKHPALFGFVIINEAYGMTSPLDSPNGGGWSDSTARLNDLRKFVNRVSGTLHRKLPGTICSVSGIAPLINQYNNDSLIYYGGDQDGILDVNQIQFYPNNHKMSYSPFSNTMEELRLSWNFENKPTIAGEFPIEGIAITNINTEKFTLSESYEALWKGTYSGGFTWDNNIYYSSSDTDKKAIETAYTTMNNSHLSTLNPWENWNKLLCDNVTSTNVVNEDLFNVYPNPTSNFVYFSKEVNYKIFNSLGIPVISGFGKSVNLSKLPKGIYMIYSKGIRVIRLSKI